MKVTSIRITVLAVLLQAYCVRVYAHSEKEAEILRDILDPLKYDLYVRPPYNKTSPLVVRVNAYMRRFGQLDDMNMEFPVQVTFRQTWKDTRLSYKDDPNLKYLTLNNPGRIWKPDLFFSNELSGNFHNIMKPNTLMRIFPDGQVLFSTRLSLKLSCPMDLKYYPMDRQTCSMVMASYAYTTDDLVFLWKEADAVQITRNLHLSHFQLEKFVTDYCTSRTVTGEYSCIRVDFMFSRNFGYYFSEVYMPSIILVMVSWISFWLDQKATTARVFVWMTTFLAFILKQACFSSQVPVVPYTKVYDIWTRACFLFLTAVIVEIGIVALLLSREERRKPRSDSPEENDSIKKQDSSEDVITQHSNPVYRIYHIAVRRFSSSHQKIDVVSCILFPLAFMFFNIFYWCYGAQHDD